MEPIVELALSIACMSQAEAELLFESYDKNTDELEDLLASHGYLDPDEYDWLAQMALQGYDAEELGKFQGQWLLARVAWSENLFPKGAEILPRLLLKNWAQRRILTLARLLEERGFSSECIFHASQLLASQLTICVRCLKVLRTRRGAPCPFCQDHEMDDSDRQLWDLYNCLSEPNPGFELTVKSLEQFALDQLNHFEKK
jgi:hypothetical protein